MKRALKRLRKSAFEKAEKDYASRSKGHASHIETYTDPILRQQSRSLFEPIDPKAKALDIGCGQGDASTCLQEKTEDGTWRPSVCQIHYIDITREMVQKGIERGIIRNSEFVRRVNASESLPYSNNTFDYVITRYFIHDLNPDEKKNLLRNVGRILRPSGKFQIIDMVANSEETQRLYNLYHSRKTKEAYRQCWIPSNQEYYELFTESGFEHIKTDSYISHVNTIDWFNEGQITKERLGLLNRIFKKEIDEGGKVKEYFNLRESKEGNILVDFPVLLICGTKAR